MNRCCSVGRFERAFFACECPRPGFRPGGRLPFFAGAKKGSKESTSNATPTARRLRPARCARYGCQSMLSQRIARQSRPFTAGGTRAASRWLTRVWHGCGRWSSVTKPRLASSVKSRCCRARLCENCHHHRPERSDRALKNEPGVLRPGCFLCLLSLHQQRKQVGRGDEIPAGGFSTRRTPDQENPQIKPETAATPATAAIAAAAGAARSRSSAACASRSAARCRARSGSARRRLLLPSDTSPARRG